MSVIDEAGYVEIAQESVVRTIRIMLKSLRSQWLGLKVTITIMIVIYGYRNDSQLPGCVA